MVFARLAAITYILWGILHLISAKQVLDLGQTLDPGILQGRVIQDAWNLMLLAFFGITVAIKYNWRNSRLGYWLNLIVVSAGDIGFVLTIIAPGYVPLIPGGFGPLLWLIAAILSTVAINRGARGAR